MRTVPSSFKNQNVQRTYSQSWKSNLVDAADFLYRLLFTSESTCPRAMAFKKIVLFCFMFTEISQQWKPKTCSSDIFYWRFPYKARLRWGKTLNTFSWISEMLKAIKLRKAALMPKILQWIALVIRFASQLLREINSENHRPQLIVGFNNRLMCRLSMDFSMTQFKAWNINLLMVNRVHKKARQLSLS